MKGIRMDKSLLFGAVFSFLLFHTPAMAQEAPDETQNACVSLVQDVSALLFRDSKARGEAHYELFSLQGGSVESVSLLNDDSLLIIHGAEDLRRGAIRNLQRLGFVFEQLSQEELATIPRRPHKPMPTSPVATVPIAGEQEAPTEPLKFRSSGKSKPLSRKLVWIRDQSQTVAAQVQTLTDQFDFEVLSYKPGLRQTEHSQIEVLQIQIKMAPEAAGTIPRAPGFVSLQPI